MIDGQTQRLSAFQEDGYVRLRDLVTDLDRDRDIDQDKLSEVSESTSVELEDETQIQPQQSVRCKNCDNTVTSPELAIEPHEHTFRNPAGYSFHILCYSDAPGAVDLGEPTTEYCWFPGYAWSFALCVQCNSHLGWWFSGPDRFIGLIATRVVR